MKKTLKTALLCLTTLLAAPTFATSGQYGPYDYILPVNEPLMIPNLSMWSVSAECTILSDVQDNLIAVKALYKKGSVNDVKLKRGDILKVSVDAGEVLRLEAESGARVELTNEGSEEITARCYASFTPKQSKHNNASFMPEETPNF
ncbi:MAG: hypothetical protein P1U39_08290 [Legionellaceae bacterium]|nr:hypothetical protein [Legionellaceae bacterium]